MQVLYYTSNCVQLIKYAHRKRKEGLIIAEIALLLHSTVKTINRYLSTSENEIQEDRKISRDRQHQLAIEQKQKDVYETRELYKQGYYNEYIGKLMHHILQTVKNYLDPSFSVVRVKYDNPISSKLGAYENKVLELRS